MKLKDVIKEVREDLKKHFRAKPYKYHNKRVKYAESEIMRITAITYNRLGFSKREIARFEPFEDMIVDTFRWKAVAKLIAD